ncbi:hypothetical protein BST40_21855 [Mycobacterium persicum]|nr:hypothetical protein BST40_21855 [Mycobacterium persicum]ORB90850.1 hypothetical protein B1T49_18230 [Mycobacterium persicum]ORB96237.1 hypothetical protein B1T44_18970 [Mycobacterium persicum]ORC02948.1 hypothetical protein B1T48_18500 [Mycobacterium persicum]
MRIAPHALECAATDLAAIGSVFSEASAAAIIPTTWLLPAGADEVSSAMTALLTAHGLTWQALSRDYEWLHQQFVDMLNGSTENTGPPRSTTPPMMRSTPPTPTANGSSDVR